MHPELFLSLAQELRRFVENRTIEKAAAESEPDSAAAP